VRTPNAVGIARLASRLRAVVGADHVTTDLDERRYLSSDFFYWDDAGVAAVVVAPGSTAEVQQVLRLVAEEPREVIIRGGGMSTGRSYVPRTHAGLLLDMRRLNAIRELNVVDRFIVVEAGCTWEAVVARLAEHQLRCDFTIPVSGSVSTVCGAMSHNVTGGMKGVLGLEVVRANGELVRTGSWARQAYGVPFCREYGPDLTGLFLGDTGAFGVKTAVALHVSPQVNVSAHASFSFETHQQLAEAMVRVAAFDFITTRVGLDPYLTRKAMDVSPAEGARVLGSIVRSDASVIGGVRKALAVAMNGRSALEDAAWTLHLRVEQLTAAAAEEGLARAREICLRAGREIAPSVAIGLSANRLSVRGTLNREGDRWIATNSVWPISRAVEVSQAVQDFLEARREEFAAHDVKVGLFTTCSGYHYQSEPLFWWRDQVSELSLRHIDPTEAERFRKIPENPRNREFVTRTRFALRDYFQALGAIHVHTSKFFRYEDLLVPGTRALLRDLKNVLDPYGVLNPGNLGL
jgi:D-lactate dehydrogenase (cytochrome)